MKQDLLELMYDLIAERSQTADSAKRARLTAMIHEIQRKLDSME